MHRCFSCDTCRVNARPETSGASRTTPSGTRSGTIQSRPRTLTPAPRGGRSSATPTSSPRAPRPTATSPRRSVNFDEHLSGTREVPRLNRSERVPFGLMRSLATQRRSVDDETRRSLQEVRRLCLRALSRMITRSNRMTMYMDDVVLPAPPRNASRQSPRPAGRADVPREYRNFAEDAFTSNLLRENYTPVKGYLNQEFLRRARRWRRNAFFENTALWCTRSDEYGTEDIFNLRRLFGEEPVAQPCHVPLGRFQCQRQERHFAERRCDLCRHHVWDTPGIFFSQGYWRPFVGRGCYGHPIPEHEVYYYSYVR